MSKAKSSAPVATPESNVEASPTLVDVSTSVASYSLAKSAKANATARSKKEGIEYTVVTQGGKSYVMPKPVEVPLIGEPKGSPKNWAEVEAEKIKSIEGYDEDKVTLVTLPKQFAIKYDGKTVCRLAHMAWASKVLAHLGLSTS